MGIKHFKTAEFDAAVAAAPLAMVDFWADLVRPLQDGDAGHPGPV